MGDLVIGVVLALGLLYGLRRGAFKMATSVVALVVATSASIVFSGLIGPLAASGLGMGVLGYFVGAAASWIVVYFLVVLAGHLLFKSLRGEGALQKAGDAAEKVAGGAARPGPVTLILKPLPKPSTVFYWADKVLGAGLGLAQAALLVLVVFLAAPALGGMGERMKTSSSYVLFQGEVEPRLDAVPQARTLRSVGEAAGVAEALVVHPFSAGVVKGHPALDPIRTYQPLKTLMEDPELKKAAEEKRYQDVINHPKVVGLLSDGEFRERFGAIDWAALRRDIDADAERRAKEKGAGKGGKESSGGK